MDGTLTGRLALLGLGVENQALGRWLAAHGLTFAVCDGDPDRRLDEEPWARAVEDWRLGPDHLDRLTDFDVLFRSPGIPTLRPELAAARDAGVAVSSQTALFLDRCPAPVVGVTGTKGKGTTACLLMAMLDGAPAISARLGGNIGIPPIAFLDELSPTDLVVLELSSFQLQDLTASPGGALLLPVATDHLDYHADRAEYVDAKGAVCRHQAAGDWVAADADSRTCVRLAEQSGGRQFRVRTAGPIEADGCWVEDGRIWWRGGGEAEVTAAVSDLRLRGPHNLANACAAVVAARMCQVPGQAIVDGLRAFRGLPHRLEEVGEAGGVLYVNDSLATTPEAAAAGLLAYADRPVVLIAGGSSKGADFTQLGRAVARHARGLVTIGEEGSRIAGAAREAGYAGRVVEGVATMADAVAAARGMASAGAAVLLSPGCASFGMFPDYAERGAAFRAAVSSD